MADLVISFTTSIMRSFLLLVLACTSAWSLSLPRHNSDWVTLWAATPFLQDGHSAFPQPFNDTDGGLLTNTTIRQTLRPSIDSPQIRFKLSNYFSTGPLDILHATVAYAQPNASGIAAGGDVIDTSCLTQVTFGEQSSTTVAAGDIIETDAVDFAVGFGQDISLSIYLGEGQRDNVTAHFNGQTSWFAAGDQTESETFENGTAQLSTYYIAALEGPVPAQAIIVLGDSISDRYGLEVNSYTGWTDDLATRLQNDSCPDRTVGNAAIGANTLNLPSGVGQPATTRLQRDVLDQAGVKYCIVFEGINDVAVQNDTNPDATFDTLVDGYTDIVSRLRENGIKAIGATLTPYSPPPQATDLILNWTPEREQTRLRINDWIMTPGNFDDVIDFSTIIANQTDPSQIQDAYAYVDFLHPNALGQQVMADAIDLGLFA